MAFESIGEGWKLFAIRLVIANLTLAIWLWVSAGNIQLWIMHDAFWRYSHLLFILITSVIIYFATLWMSGVRMHHLMVSAEVL